MRTNLSKLIILATVLATALPLAAQEKKKKAAMSPHETVSAEIDGAKVSISYGRPYIVKPGTTEVRKIWGGLVPYGKVWRTGANEATILTTDQTLDIGGTTVPAGKYSLYTLPSEDGAKLIINKQTGQWGTVYEEKEDLARVDMKKESLDKTVDQFTMAIDKNPSGGVIKMAWEKTGYSVAFTVKK
jgi:hypothetical protein